MTQALLGTASPPTGEFSVADPVRATIHPATLRCLLREMLCGLGRGGEVKSTTFVREGNRGPEWRGQANPGHELC